MFPSQGHGVSAHQMECIMETTQVLDQVVCFSLEGISLWGARKKLNEEDVSLGAGGTLPPKDIASLGSKKIFNPKILNTFDTLKKQAHTACAKVGVRFMGGYAVAEADADKLAEKLDAIGVEFEAAKADFVASYETELALWIKEHPGWESWIRRATLPVEDVASKYSYGWTPAKVTPPSAGDQTNRLNQKMTEEVGGLAGQLFKEIADMADKIRSNSLLGKDRVNRRVLSSLNSIRAKLNGLAFLDKRVKPLIKGIDEVVAIMPGDAPIEGVALSALYGLMVTMSSPERMREFGEAILEGKPVEESMGINLKAAQKQGKAAVVDIEQPVVTESVEAGNLFVKAAASEPEALVVPKQPAMEAFDDLFGGNLFAAAAQEEPMVKIVVKEEPKLVTPEPAMPIIPSINSGARKRVRF